jgi:hypothetical protein
MRRVLALRAVTSAVLALCVWPAGAQSNVPSAITSRVDQCLVFCPVSDIDFHVLVRDLASVPVANSVVKLDFSGCPSFTHCLGVPSSITVSDANRTVSMVADASGAVVFAMPMGGICPGSAVRIYADGVLLAIRSLASPDRDGNGFPDLTDEAAIQALVGSSDPTADFDCNGIVDAADVAISAQHRFHACPLAVPTAPRSWGALKIHYR